MENYTQEWLDGSSLSASWKSYFKKGTFTTIKLKDGEYMPIDKSRIETSFCFGYGYCGVSNNEEIDGAYRMEEHARSSQDYFKEENLKAIDSRLESLKDPHNVILIYKGWAHMDYSITDKWRLAEDMWKYPKDAREATSEERALIIEGVEAEKANFAKRLDVYLKKYGLSKLRTWTYLRD